MLLGYGITAIHDTAMSPRAEVAYRLLAAQARLPISILGFPHAAELLAGPDPGRWDGLVTGEGDEHFRVGPVKIFADGVWPPACDGRIDGQHIQFGDILPGLDDHIRVRSLVASALLSTPSAMSASRALSTAGAVPLRVGSLSTACGSSTSCSGVSTELDEMRRLGVTGVIQPGFVVGLGDVADAFDFDEHTWLPFVDLDSRGIPLAASSDSPCTDTVAPIPLSRLGVHRQTTSGKTIGPEQSLPLTTWLRLWTAERPTRASNRTNEAGSARGCAPDFVVVLDGSPDDTLEVAQTWVAGERVYDVAST